MALPTPTPTNQKKKNKNPFTINKQPQLYAMFETLNNINEIVNIEPFYFRGHPSTFPNQTEYNGYIIQDFKMILLNETIAGSIGLNVINGYYEIKAQQLYSIGSGSKFSNQTSTNYISMLGIGSIINLNNIFIVGWKTTVKNPIEIP